MPGVGGVAGSQPMSIELYKGAQINSKFNLWPPVNVGVWSGECKASVHIVVAEIRVSLYHVKCYILYKIGQQCHWVGREHKIKNNQKRETKKHVQLG